MSSIQAIIEELQSRDYSDRNLLAVLKDGEALDKIGLGDESKANIEAAYNSIFDRVFPGVSSCPLDDDEPEDARAMRFEDDLRYYIKGDL